MNKEEFQVWLNHKAETQQKLTLAAAVAMIAIGLFALLIQAGILYALISFGYGSAVAFLVLLALFGGMGFYTWNTAPQRLKDQEFAVQADDNELKIRIVPTMSNTWTFAMGSLESDQSIPERIFGMLMIVPRMFWTSWYTFQRWQRLQQLDLPSCAIILRILLRKAERVEVETFADKRPDLDLPRILYEVSMLDGVVFLTKRGLGLSLAPRLTEDLAKWRQRRGDNAGKDGEGYLFEE